MGDVKDAMGKDEIEPIKTKAEALAQAAAGLMQYAQPGAAEGAPGAEGAAASAAGQDDVLDAEFEEVKKKD